MFLEKTINGLIIDKIDRDVLNGYLLKVLSSEKIFFIRAKGLKKIDSKNRIGTEIGSFSELEVLVSKETYLLKRANLLTDYLLLIKTQPIIYKKIIDLFSIINEANPKFLSCFKIVMEEIINIEDEIQFVQTFLISKLLEGKGIQLSFDKCIFCNSNQNLSYFSFSEGGIICFPHSKQKTNLEELKTFYYLSKPYKEFYKNTNYSNAKIVYTKLKEFIKENY